MAPTSDALPPLAAWTPVDGKLRWQWDREAQTFAVSAFRTRLNPVLVQEKGDAASAPVPRPERDQRSLFRAGIGHRFTVSSDCHHTSHKII